MNHAGNSLISVQSENGMHLASLTCEQIIGEDDVRKLGDEILALVVDNSPIRLIISFATVRQITSSALSKLITIKRRVDDTDGQLRLCDMQTAIADVFRIARLNEYFQICADQKEAMQSLR